MNTNQSSTNAAAQQSASASGAASDSTGISSHVASDTIALIGTDERFVEFENSFVNYMGMTDQSILDQMALHNVVGATVIIIEGGQISQRAHYGWSDFTKFRLTDSDTVYHAASLSKFVAGLTFAVAHENGDIRLKRKLSRYVDDHSGSLLDLWQDTAFNAANEDYQDSITMARLLSHTAGMDGGEWHGIGTSSLDQPISYTDVLFGGVCLTFPDCGGVGPTREPGTTYDYSGGGYIVAEQILELETGRSFADYATSELLEPLGMNESTYDNAHYGMTNLARKCNYLIPGGQNCAVYTTDVKTAGGLIAQPEDYARMLTIFMNDGLDETGARVIELDALRNAMTPVHHKDSSKAMCTTDTQCPNSETCFQNACYAWPVDSDNSSETERYGLGVDVSAGVHTDGYPKVLKHGGHDWYMGAAHEMFINRATRSGIVVFTNGPTKDERLGADLAYHEFGGLAFAAEVIEAFKAVYQ